MSFIINPYIFAAGLTPSDISNIFDWWEPARESYANNDPIGTLTGQFAANNFTATGAARPTFKTNQLNGLAISDWNGATPNQMAVVPTSPPTTAAHVFGILQATNDPGVSQQDMPWAFSGSGDFWSFTDGNVYVQTGSNTGLFNLGNPTSTLVAWRCFEVTSISNEWILKIDGTQFGSTQNPNTVGFNANWYLGGNNFNQWWTGQIAGVYVFSAKLSSGDRTSMVNYLNTRFGLSIS